MDYAVDLRKESPTYLKWVGVELSKDSSKYTEILKKNNLKNKNQIKAGMYLCL